ncbi:hypothetical protein ACFW6V_08865 [Streptomyces sp. NPDC058734]|uniref:hypothetical protein n=1 Tax=Streptomyces sp. NPDC058734 TaxID=3346615 RepID=UPI0036B9BBC2
MPSTAQVPEGTESLLVEEVVLFVSVHLGRSPGLMWLEHEPPDPGALAEFLPAALARRLDRPVGVLPHVSGDTRIPHDLLVCQLGGSGTWHIAPPTGSALTLRLRTGAALYAPAGSVCTPRHSAGSRVLLLALGAPKSQNEKE